MPKPFIIVAFANFYQDNVFLPALKQEVEAVEYALQEAEKKGICSYRIIREATREKVESVFQDAELLNRITIFHYAGHASFNKLFFEGKDGTSDPANAFGLLPLLTTADSLKLVFLNGCLTSKMATQLNRDGIPAVIGTVSRVKDSLSMRLAKSFYEGLVKGLPLDKSWQQSTASIKSQIGEEDYREYYKADSSRGDIPFGGLEEDRLPWEIYYRKGAEEIKYWNLPGAAGQPLFGLPEIKNKYDLPNVPYRLMSAYTRADARVFFGRGTYIQDLFQRLNSSLSAPVILFFGASGAGKSSILDAGLYPRLSELAQIRFEQRSPQKGLLWNVRKALELPEGTPVEEYLVEAEKWKNAWHEIERKEQQKFILILDQVEEVFTRKADTTYDELRYLVQCIGYIFSDPGSRPKGKLMLTYRKEFHAEIRSCFHQYNIPNEEVFLKNLDQEGIKEVVNGLRSTKEHRLKYQLNMDEQLATNIALDLSKEANSPVAPILQILLSRLWQSQASKTQKYFSLKDYQQLKSEGIYLDDFFQRQIAAIRKWESGLSEKIEASGLVLDVLHFHTTDIGTAASHPKALLEAEYAHQKKFLNPLLHKLQSLQLLYEKENGHTALTHDTLAPIIQKHHRASDRPGQRARRILETKISEFAFAPEEVFIDEIDLAIVEKGIGGMRNRNSQERKLVDKSRQRRNKLERKGRRNRMLAVFAFALLFILSIALGLFAQKSQDEASINHFISQALINEKIDPVKAMKEIQQALAVNPEHQVALQTRHDVYSAHEFYEKVIPHPAAVVAVDVSSDNLIASASGQQLFIWSEQGEAMRSIQLEGEITALTFSPNGQQLLVGTKDNSAIVCQIDGQRIRRLDHEDWVTAVHFDPEGQFLLTGDRLGQMHIWPKDEGEAKLIPAHMGPILSLEISTTTNTLMSGGWDGALKIWDQSGTLLNEELQHEDRVLSLDLSSDGERLLTACRNAEGNVWSLADGNRIRLLGHQQRVNKALWTQGQYILTASDDYTIKLWTEGGQALRDYKGHRSFVHDIALSKDQRWFASVSADSSLRIWPLESKVVRFTGNHTGEVSTLTYSGTNNEILTACRTTLPSSGDFEDFDVFETTLPHEIFRWNSDGQLLQTYKGHEGDINSLAISPDQKYLLSGGADGQAILWGANGEIIRQIKTTSSIQSVAFSSSGDQVLFAEEDSLASRWSIKGEKLTIYAGHKDLVSKALFSADGKYVLTASYDDTLRLYDLEGTLIRKFIGHSSRVSSIAFHPNGQQILSAGWDNRAILWTMDGQQLHSFYLDRKNKTGGQAINCLAFSPDGQLLALGAEDGLIKIFTNSGQEIQTLQSPERKGVYSLAFSPNGKWLTTGGGAKEVRSWRIVSME